VNYFGEHNIKNRAVLIGLFILLPKNWTVQMINKFELLNEQKEKKIQFRV
jgi:hypothetical protein